MLPDGQDMLDWPCSLKVSIDMLEAAEKSFTAMFEECPKVRFTVPIQEDVSECILEAVLLNSTIEAIENNPDKELSAQDTHDKHENINHRYKLLMDKHEDLKVKVQDAKTTPPRNRQVKRHLTDEDVEETCPDTQPMFEDTQPFELDEQPEDSQAQE